MLKHSRVLVKISIMANKRRSVGCDEKLQNSVEKKTAVSQARARGFRRALSFFVREMLAEFSHGGSQGGGRWRREAAEIRECKVTPFSHY